MFLAAYIVTGFLIASVYAVGMLRGRRDRYHRLGFMIPFTLAAIATPIQLFVGDTAARAIADDQPAKFAAMECIYKGGPDQTEYLGGICADGQVKGGIGIPGLDSFLVGFSKNTDVTGLNQIPKNDQPPAKTMLHLSFDTMVGIATAALPARRVWFAITWWRRARPAGPRLVPADGAMAGVARGGGARVRLDRHRGRAPALDRQRLHAHGGRGHPGPGDLVGVRRDAGALHRARGDRVVGASRPLAPLAQSGDEPRATVPYGPPAEAAVGGIRMSKADVCAAILWVGVTLYAIFGGADFGAGVWDLLAGRATARERVRRQIDRSIGPVWEANHVWLIFVLVMLWTAFSHRLLGDLHHALHPACPRGARDRPAGVGLRLPPRSAGTRGAARQPGLRVRLGADARSSWARWSGRSPPGRCPPAATAIPRELDRASCRWSPAPSSCWSPPTPPPSSWCTTRARPARTSSATTSSAARWSTAVIAGAAAVVGVIALHADGRYVYDGLTSWPGIAAGHPLRGLRPGRARPAGQRAELRAAGGGGGRRSGGHLGILRRRLPVHPADLADHLGRGGCLDDTGVGDRDLRGGRSDRGAVADPALHALPAQRAAIASAP